MSKSLRMGLMAGFIAFQVAMVGYLSSRRRQVATKPYQKTLENRYEATASSLALDLDGLSLIKPPVGGRSFELKLPPEGEGQTLRYRGTIESEFQRDAPFKTIGSTKMETAITAYGSSSGLAELKIIQNTGSFLAYMNGQYLPLDGSRQLTRATMLCDSLGNIQQPSIVTIVNDKKVPDPLPWVSVSFPGTPLELNDQWSLAAQVQNGDEFSIQSAVAKLLDYRNFEGSDCARVVVSIRMRCPRDVIEKALNGLQLSLPQNVASPEVSVREDRQYLLRIKDFQTAWFESKLDVQGFASALVRFWIES